MAPSFTLYLKKSLNYDTVKGPWYKNTFFPLAGAIRRGRKTQWKEDVIRLLQLVSVSLALHIFLRSWAENLQLICNTRHLKEHHHFFPNFIEPWKLKSFHGLAYCYFFTYSAYLIMFCCNGVDSIKQLI